MPLMRISCAGLLPAGVDAFFVFMFVFLVAPFCRDVFVFQLCVENKRPDKWVTVAGSDWMEGGGADAAAVSDSGQLCWHCRCAEQPEGGSVRRRNKLLKTVHAAGNDAHPNQRRDSIQRHRQRACAHVLRGEGGEGKPRSDGMSCGEHHGASDEMRINATHVETARSKG